MYAQGYGYNKISIETKVSANVIRNRLGKTKDKVAINRPRGTYKYRPIFTRPTPLITYKGKYDHLLEEPINQGKMYADYQRKSNR